MPGTDSPMDLAVRIVAETDDDLVIEGPIAFGGPFPGNSDSYGTRATSRTNFYWDLFPDRKPDDPPEVEPTFVRPVNYQHGFDTDVGLTRVGGFSPMRADKKAIWLRAQIDKHDAYYNELRQMIGDKKLGFSPESAEHAVRFSKNGDWLDWPIYTVALTPTPSNPWNVVAARAAEVIRVSGVPLEGSRAVNKAGKAVGPPEGGKAREDIPAEDFAGPDKSYPIVNQASVDDAASLIGKAENPEAVKAKIIAIAKRKGLKIPDAWQKGERSAFRSGVPADDAACAAHILSDLSYLMGCETDEPDQLKMLKDAFDCVTQFLAAESAEIGSEDDPSLNGQMGMPAFYSATRAGRRNSASDLSLIDGIHDASVSLGASAHAGDTPPSDESHQVPSADRKAQPLPIRVTGLERVNAKALRKAAKKALRKASRIGSQVGAAEAEQVLR